METTQVGGLHPVVRWPWLAVGQPDVPSEGELNRDTINNSSRRSIEVASTRGDRMLATTVVLIAHPRRSRPLRRNHVGRIESPRRSDLPTVVHIDEVPGEPLGAVLLKHPSRTHAFIINREQCKTTVQP